MVAHGGGWKNSMVRDETPGSQGNACSATSAQRKPLARSRTTSTGSSSPWNASSQRAQSWLIHWTFKRRWLA